MVAGTLTIRASLCHAPGLSWVSRLAIPSTEDGARSHLAVSFRQREVDACNGNVEEGRRLCLWR